MVNLIAYGYKSNKEGKYQESIQSSTTTCDPKLKSCSWSSHLIKKFIMLINVKMSTFVGILTSISMINTTDEI